MQKLVLFLAVSLLVALPARAETPFSCAGGTVKKITIRADRMGLRFNATVPAGTLDPVTNGVSIEVSYEPEADPANAIYSVTLPADKFTVSSSGTIHYKDTNGTFGGMRKMTIKSVPGGQRVSAIRLGVPLPGTPRSGNLRVVLSSGSTCGRTCGAPCATRRTNSILCKASTDTALCGFLSGCELLNTASGQCMFPYPSSVFEADDATTPTGKRLAFLKRGMPANNAGTHIDPTQWNVLDGYSAGPLAMVAFAHGVDLAASNVPPQSNFPASLGPASPIVLLDADTGDRVPVMGENDLSCKSNCNATPVPVSPPGQAFLLRPGVRLKNSGHYIIALRGLIDQNADPIVAEPAFAALRDATPSGSAAVEARRANYENVIFPKLFAAGIPRNNLIMAWDFHTASDAAIETWLLHMRDEVFTTMGSSAPPFTVTSVEDNPFSGDTRVCRRVRGTYQVPRYVNSDTPPAFLNIVNGLPQQTGVTNAPFTVMVPCSLVTPTPSAGRPIFYGHGLLGTGDGEVTSDHLRTLANTYGFVVAATDWQGMATADVNYIISTITSDFSFFHELPERLHQGVLNQLVLGHLLGAANGLSADPSLKFDDGMGHMVPVIDPSEVFYYGNSQGGIFGGTVMALAQETTRGVLGVPAANFSTLLQRSVDFTIYFTLIRGSYPVDLARMLSYPLIQQLWDRAEPNGWYHHTISDPLPNTPAHKVLVHMATNDAEVCNLGTQIMVRSMGISQLTPVINSYFDIGEVAAPFDGSAMHESNEGDPAVPTTNVPPPNNPAHGNMRKRPAIQAEINDFLQTGGMVTNHCSGPCDPE